MMQLAVHLGEIKGSDEGEESGASSQRCVTFK
jgi:hypothetical protein